MSACRRGNETTASHLVDARREVIDGGLVAVMGDTGVTMCRRLFVAKDEHRFSCAHMTLFPDGTKERIHGHNYHVGVAIRWDVEARDREAGDVEAQDLEAGFVDLSLLKSAVEALCSQLREHLLMPSKSEKVAVVLRDELSTEMLVCGKRYVIPTDEVLWLPVENIVVEELAEYLWGRLDADLGATLVDARVSAMEVVVTEASGQGASYASSPGGR